MIAASGAALCAVLIAGCGDGETTTVIQQGDGNATTQTVTQQVKTVTEKQKVNGGGNEPAPEPETPEQPSGSPPDVVGLTLPAAQKILKSAGFKADVSNTDTTFGILVPSNYTVCKQDDAVGNLVPILAQKYGC